MNICHGVSFHPSLPYPLLSNCLQKGEWLVKRFGQLIEKVPMYIYYVTCYQLLAYINIILHVTSTLEYFTKWAGSPPNSEHETFLHDYSITFYNLNEFYFMCHSCLFWYYISTALWYPYLKYFTYSTKFISYYYGLNILFEV